MTCSICNQEVELSKLRNHIYRHTKSDIIQMLLNNDNDTISKNCSLTTTASKDKKKPLGETNLESKNNSGDISTTPKRSTRKRKRTLKATTYETTLKDSDKDLFSGNESDISSFSIFSKDTEPEKDPGMEIENPANDSSIKIENDSSIIKMENNSDTCSVDEASFYLSPVEESCEKCGVALTQPNDLTFYFKNLKCCLQCNIDGQARIQKEEIYYATEVKVYVCHYCSKEFVNRRILEEHLKAHLEESVLDDVLSIEKDFLNEHRGMNTFYNYFNAGYHYGKRCYNSEYNPVEFYNYFLRYATNFNMYQLDNFGYYCELCKFTYFNLNTIEHHQRYFHLVNF